MTWRVHLVGPTACLDALARTVQEPDCTIRRRDDVFLMESSDFDGLGSADLVRDRAAEHLDALTGLARLELGLSRPLEVDAVEQEGPDGQLKSFVHPPPATLGLAGTLGLVAIGADGTARTVYAPGDLIPPRREALARNPDLRRAVVRWGNGTGWPAVIAVRELIADGLGKGDKKRGYDALLTRGWASPDELRRLKETVNSSAAIGDAARHPVERGAAPRDPLKLSEARTLVARLLEAWVDYEVRRLPSKRPT